MMRNCITLLIAVCLVVFYSCKSGNNLPKDIIPVDSMKFIVWDMMQADELASQRSLKDTVHKLSFHTVGLYKDVLAAHHLTKEQFYKSYNYYLSRPDLNKILTDSLVNLSTRKITPEVKKEPNPKELKIVK